MGIEENKECHQNSCESKDRKGINMKLTRIRTGIKVGIRIKMGIEITTTMKQK